MITYVLAVILCVIFTLQETVLQIFQNELEIQIPPNTSRWTGQ